jgi:serine/threonine-protein kinase
MMQPGTLLAQRYRIDAKLGEGGMGTVYKAHDAVLDRAVAIKVLSSQFTREGAERLLREARLVAQLDHPHVVAVHDAGQIDGQPFIAMQLVAGKSLREATVSIEQAIEIAKQVCQALEYAHGKGLIHRDNLTRENIMDKALHMNMELPLLLPGIKLTTSPTDHRPIKQMRLVRFNGERYVLFSDVLASE